MRGLTLTNKQGTRFDQSTSCTIPNKAVSIPVSIPAYSLYKAVSIPVYSLYDDQDTSPSCILIHMVYDQRHGHPLSMVVVSAWCHHRVDNISWLARSRKHFKPEVGQ